MQLASLDHRVVEDHDLQRAAALGLLGQEGVVHAIERGVRHTAALLGQVSSRTAGSWWVPYEIGFSRAAGKSSNFVVTGDPRDVQLPSFARIAATYMSVDELARVARRGSRCRSDKGDGMSDVHLFPGPTAMRSLRKGERRHPASSPAGSGMSKEGNHVTEVPARLISRSLA
jgi:hypothetical protein